MKAVTGQRDEEKIRSFFDNLPEGFAYHRIILDIKRKPCDYVFLEMNRMFEKLTGLKRKDTIGKRVTEVIPGIEKDPADWIRKYGKVALSGKPVQFESYSKTRKRWFCISAFSPRKGYCAVIFSDITDCKRSQEESRAASHELRNSLAAIAMAAVNIKRKAKNPDIDTHLVNIEKKITESDQIINNLLVHLRPKAP